MLYIVVDTEANGPHPGKYSMIELGAVVVGKNRNGVYEIGETFFANFAPRSNDYDPAALKAIGRSHIETLQYPVASYGMVYFSQWINDMVDNYGVSRAQFVADNAGFDWQFVNTYLHMFVGDNPFGYSPFSLTSFYKGIEHNMKASFKRLRKTKHYHNALADAMGNAEALCTILQTYDIKGV